MGKDFPSLVNIPYREGAPFSLSWQEVRQSALQQAGSALFQPLSSASASTSSGLTLTKTRQAQDEKEATQRCTH